MRSELNFKVENTRNSRGINSQNMSSKLLKIAVGSTNKVKVNAAKEGAEKSFLGEAVIEAEGFDVPSNISDQPFGDAETQLGAINRAKNAYEEYTNKYQIAPDFAVGLEGGVMNSVSESELECFAWIVVYDGKSFGKARTGSFTLPPVIRDLILIEKMELGLADDLVFKTINSKQGGGSVGQFTRGVIDRTSYYVHAAVLAFIPFHWSQLYAHEELYVEKYQGRS